MHSSQSIPMLFDAVDELLMKNSANSKQTDSGWTEKIYHLFCFENTFLNMLINSL